MGWSRKSQIQQLNNNKPYRKSLVKTSDLVHQTPMSDDTIILIFEELLPQATGSVFCSVFCLSLCLIKVSVSVV